VGVFKTDEDGQGGGEGSKKTVLVGRLFMDVFDRRLCVCIICTDSKVNKFSLPICAEHWLRTTSLFF